MGRARKTPKPKQQAYQRIERAHDPMGVYTVLDELKDWYRPDLAECRLSVAWRTGLKRNKDGHLTLGKCKKVSELDKEYAAFDMIVILNREAYALLSDEQRAALVYHELCHIAVAEDQNGNPKRDAKNRLVFRLKKHDIEEFGDVIARFGCYKQDLENFVATAMRSPKPPSRTLLDGLEPEPAAPADEGKGEAALVPPEAAEPEGGVKESPVERLKRERKRPVPKKHAGRGGRGKERSR